VAGRVWTTAVGPSRNVRCQADSNGPPIETNIWSTQPTCEPRFASSRSRTSNVSVATALSFGGSLEYLREDDQWEALIGELESTEWVSHIEPPPGAQSRPEHIVRYLTRYLTGGPISDYRITAADDQTVTFMARQGNVTGGEREQVPHTLETPEFIRRWSLHIQSPQLTKTRQFGGWSSTHKEQYMASYWPQRESATRILDRRANLAQIVSAATRLNGYL